jgi:site-specific recombinase XerD
VSGPLLLPSWEQLAVLKPQMVATMRRYLEQIACILRPRSVVNTDMALRSFAAFLVETAPEVTSTADVVRCHVEDYKPWLAQRPGQNKPRVTTATVAHRLGTLRMFFVRIDEWGWHEAPPRVPMFPGDLPRQDHPLPKALDDAAAAKLLRAAQNDKRLLVRVTVEVLLRTGLRVSEYTGLCADAVVLIGAAPWLHVPVGKLHDDRYLPLHPNLVTLIDDYRAKYVPAGHPLLLPRENGRPLDRHTVTRMINKAGAAAGLPHIHPHSCGTPWPPRPSTAARRWRRSPPCSGIMPVILSSRSCQEAFWSSRARRPSKIFCRPSWPLSAASSRCACRVGRNSMVVWKKVQLSQMDSKWQSRPTGRAQ